MSINKRVVSTQGKIDLLVIACSLILRKLQSSDSDFESTLSGPEKAAVLFMFTEGMELQAAAVQPRPRKRKISGFNPPNPLMVQIGKILAKERKAQGLSQEEISSRLNISQAHWSRFERGERMMSKKLLSKAESILGKKIGKPELDSQLTQLLNHHHIQPTQDLLDDLARRIGVDV
jgi:transcriptional regulator with XRE-family HTH domain